jgi:catechol 2,3-dioxygenase-like lactoylglutathione lyase family enzyme
MRSMALARWLLLSLAALLSLPATAAEPVKIGLDHIPIAVRDLEAASATYRALGFALKPGRPHANGIRNAHVKFPDGAGLELLTVPAAVDALSTKYLNMIRAGDGPGFLSFHARDTAALHASLRAGGQEFAETGGLTDLRDPALAYLFWIQDNRSPTDRPEHFAHPNGAKALRAVWIATDDGVALVSLLQQLGGRVEHGEVLAPDPVEATVVTLDEGEVIILPAHHQLLKGRPIVGASFRVTDLATVRKTLSASGIPAWTGPANDERVVVEPQRAHGLWLEFQPDTPPSKALASANPASFAVAVTEGDTLLPIARYGAGGWLNTWPEPEEDSKEVPALADVPVAWLGGPVPPEWNLVFAIGGSTPVQIAGTERTGGCVVSPKLKMRNPPVPPAGSFDEIHAGLATTNGGVVAAVRQIVSRAGSGTTSTDDALVKRLQPVVQSLFDAHEQKALERARTSDGSSTTAMSPALLAKATPTIDWMYRSLGADPSVLYVEASKRPMPAPGERLGVSAWLRLAANGDVVPLRVDAGIELDDAPPGDDSITNVPDQVPLGVINVGGRDVWFMEAHFSESADFLLYEVAPTVVRRILRVDGGGC